MNAEEFDSKIEAVIKKMAKMYKDVKPREGAELEDAALVVQSLYKIFGGAVIMFGKHMLNSGYCEPEELADLPAKKLKETVDELIQHVAEQEREKDNVED